MPDFFEISIYLWFVPVVLQIMLPLILLFILLPAKILGFKFHRIDLAKKGNDCIEKRFGDSDRVNIEKSTVDISYNFERITGKISNVSISGICIDELPLEKLQNPDKLYLRVNGENGPFSMLVKTKWEHTQQSGKSVGAKIENAPPSWFDFVEKANQ